MDVADTSDIVSAILLAISEGVVYIWVGGMGFESGREEKARRYGNEMFA